MMKPFTRAFRELSSTGQVSAPEQRSNPFRFAVSSKGSDKN